MKEIERAFKALSDKNRLRILMMLTRKPLCVCEIREVLKLSVSTVSKHLSVLRGAGFITDEKDGKWVNYRLNSFTEDTLSRQLIIMLPMWMDKDEQVRSDMQKVMQIDRIKICEL